ncbi:hypothetical protein JCGZ_13409 [Jatropha curcas]|uniref:Rad21/Rec8-like protein N-terminal domain-containing protein n=1 Tax=Jatropha curcas TaxID=180498 RepID=A0A067KKZ2_JATCU|nr:sister chromatid cohesion 1 protein 4 isoform X2 [Jatropha curcas]KDP32484.1 hypothetical protein JCGZ_13409 [Jatropha curcas]
MFYSQFILAKKGPLGTIWIAAHLERKLRKNQVADTDIGVSVDSILFPEVPIALRLSSHLLLGVVRIYSRKVNYLFDDCSEALLKIKQAFRSTAVDLPPEESTAPYHSITLPETFDLDDFELPDNDIFQGNYVDHHVSTREQITLQDTMEGVVFSTSQFGLDERFGDGDTSQVGLDLEEDLLLEKVTAVRHDEVSENDALTDTEQMPHPEDTSHERMTGSSEDMPLNGTRNKIEGFAANVVVIDYAQAPSTPGLVEEPNVSSFKEGLTCDDHLESEDHSLRGLVGVDSSEDAPTKSDLPHRGGTMHLSLGDQLNHDNIMCTPAEENSHFSGDLEINQSGLGGDFHSNSVATEHILANGTVDTLDGLDKVEDTDKVVSCNNEQTCSPVDQINGEYEESIGVRLQETEKVETAYKMEESNLNGKNLASNNVNSLESPIGSECINVEGQSFQAQGKPETLNGHLNNQQMAPACTVLLRACNSNLSQTDMPSCEVSNPMVIPDLQSADDVSLPSDTVEREEGFHASRTSTKVQGQECDANDVVQSEENQVSEPTLGGEIQVNGEKHEELLDNSISNGNQCENLSSSMTDLPAPEKLLSLPRRLLDEPLDLVVETPDKEVQIVHDRSGAGTEISGKKRSFTESSLTAKSLKSIESFGASRLERTAVDSIPDDDDLLSSILVGRRSSVLKMKPTPPAPEVPPIKRTRFASRPSALKRKVLMDDSMVLHGDTIRQQLTSTEDIRRLRKKAPCTRTEILMIQRQFLEEEIFSEPVLTGMSAELAHLHNEALDLSGIMVSENDDNNNAPLELVNDEDSAKQIVNQDSEIEGALEPVGFRNDTDGLPSELPIQNDNQQAEGNLGSHDIDNQEHINGSTETADYKTSEHEHLGERSEIEINKLNSQLAHTTNQTVSGLETFQSEPVFGDILEMPTATLDQSAVTEKTFGADDFMQIDTLNLSNDKIDTQLIKEDAFIRDMSNDRELDGIEVGENCVEQAMAVGAELGTGEGMLLEESKVAASIEISADVQADGSAPADVADTSLANVSSETGGCVNLSSVNVDKALEDIENDKHEVLREDGDLAASLACIDDKDQASNHLCNEESKTDSTYLVALDGDFKNASLNGEYTVCQQDDLQGAKDVENAPRDHLTAGYYGDFPDVAFANDTEFLNVDDDEIGEDDEEGMPNAEDTGLLENSGWSSRTRAVAKYLQILFDKEAGQGRKVLSMDNLLAGKTRKEASRMFFETLVLKTRDYVHVEQAKPFDNIDIKPRAKLMKSEF